VIRILDVTKNHRWHALVVLALHTGMRRGELAGLRWSDIDFNTNEIHVQQQHNRFDEDDDLKSIHSDRIIPLSRTARAALMDHGINETDRLATLTNPHVDRVFTGKTGQPIILRSMSRWYNERAKDAQLSDYGWHAFRHTFASRSLAAGVPIVDVSEWLGHADPSVTLALYSWALPGEKTNRIDLLDRHLNDINS
jgi:integrase